MLSSTDIRGMVLSLVASAGEQFGLKMVDKRTSTLMKVIYWVTFMRFWNRDFLTGYTTTIGRTMYLPRDPRDFGSQGAHDLALINHELQHIKDSITVGRFSWTVYYLFPQNLALLALLGFSHRIWLVFLIALLPLPAPFRVWAETRAYAVSLAVRARCGYDVGPIQYEAYRLKFTGWAYYRMAWSWPPVRAELERLATKLIELSPN